MYLLELSGNDQFGLKHFPGEKKPRYAILSHTWGEDHEEVNFRDIQKSTGQKKPGYQKVRFCAEQAARDKLDYFWVDTCCIDKSNSSEVSEAIASMFKWYQRTEKCYVYLSDVSSGERKGDRAKKWMLEFKRSRWFTRGWTLQELIAPKSVQFFSKEQELL